MSFLSSVSGKDKNIKIGYAFGFGIHMGAVRGPVDQLVQIKVGGKTAWSGSVSDNTSFDINKPNLFGGDKGEGGIDGRFHVMMGASDQTVNASLASMLGGIVPAFRGVVTFFFDGWVTALNPYPKQWSFRLRRHSAGWDGSVWYPEKALITLTDPETGGSIHAMNPAHILYELETNRDWGRGRARSRLDDDSFRAAADQCYAEGLGLCLRWNRSDSIANFANSVISHMGGNLFTSRVNGLRKLTLARDDYDPELIPHFTPESGLLEIAEDDNSTTSDAINEVRVSWRNPIDNTNRMVRERNLAGVVATGGRVVTEEVSYVGLPTYELASRVAKRDLRAKGIAKKWDLVLDRRARDIEPGQVFKFSHPGRGLSEVVVRAARIQDKGKITITAVLDVFGLPNTSFTNVVPSGWIPPNTTPQTVTTRRLREATWRDLVLAMDAPNLELVSASAGYALVLAARPTSLSLNYDLQSRVGSAEWTTKAAGDFCPSALLVGDLEPYETTAVMVSGVDLSEVDPGTAALINDEIIRIDSIDLDTNVITFGRGCVDTVPAKHLAGDRIWFIDDLAGGDPNAYTATTTLNIRLLTNTSSDQLDPALAASDSIMLAARHSKPYPPGNLVVNAVAWPSAVSADINVEWAHRDAKLQADQLIDTTEDDIGPEVGTTYDVRLYNDGTNALLVSHVDITGNSDTILEGELAGLDGVTMRLEVNSKLSGQESTFRQIRVFTWTATP